MKEHTGPAFARGCSPIALVPPTLPAIAFVALRYLVAEPGSNAGRVEAPLPSLVVLVESATFRPREPKGIVAQARAA